MHQHKTNFEAITPRLMECGEVLWITLNKPKANILDVAMMGELSYALDAHRNDSQLKLVVIQGAGGNFSYGASVKEHQKESVSSMLPQFHALARKLASYPVPIAAMVEGNCLGGAFELVLCCHFVFANEHAQMGCPEIKLGVFPPVLAAIGAMRLNPALAERLTLCGNTLGAKEALADGFVTKIFEPSNASSNETLLLGWFKENLKSLSAFSLRQATKATRKGSGVLAGLGGTLDDLEEQYLGELMQSYDANEGIESFIEKRKPVWKNA